MSLLNHPLFTNIPSITLSTICKSMTHGKIQAGHHVFRQGDAGVCFFVIREGQVEVHVDHKPVRVLSSGDTFGELALLFRSVRSASVVSLTEC